MGAVVEIWVWYLIPFLQWDIRIVHWRNGRCSDAGRFSMICQTLVTTVFNGCQPLDQRCDGTDRSLQSTLRPWTQISKSEVHRSDISAFPSQVVGSYLLLSLHLIRWKLCVHPQMRSRLATNKLELFLFIALEIIYIKNISKRTVIFAIMQRPRMKSVAWLYRNGSGVF